jgi:hypothetical protein
MVPNHFRVKCSIAVPCQLPRVRAQTRQDASAAADWSVVATLGSDCRRARSAIAMLFGIERRCAAAVRRTKKRE